MTAGTAVWVPGTPFRSVTTPGAGDAHELGRLAREPDQWRARALDAERRLAQQTEGNPA